MNFDDVERTVELLATRTSFEAETIAAALRERGVQAQAIDAQNAQLWGGAFGGAKVLVLESHHHEARAALSDIRREAGGIDWTAIDWAGDDDSEHEGEVIGARRRRKHRRAALTLAMLCVPVGFVVLSHGTLRHNPSVQLIGGTLMMLSVAIWVVVHNARRNDETR